MLEVVHKVLAFFDPRERIRAGVLLILMVMNSGLEMVGIGLIFPIITIVSDPQYIEKAGYLNRAYVMSGARGVTVFGMAPRMRRDLLVNDFVYRAVTDRFVLMFESHFKRNYIHVRDVANTFLFALGNWERMRGETYNAGLSGANLSKAALCERIRAAVPDFQVFESDVGEDPDRRDYIVSNEKLESLGWRPEYGLDDGIKELVKGYTMIRDGGAFDTLG